MSKQCGKEVNTIVVVDPPKSIDMVNHPPHYTSGGIECIEAIKAALTDEEFEGFCKGNILKYTWREKCKNKMEDIKKANFYMSRLIKHLEEIEEKK